jgi:hypothetical protein
MKEMIKLSPKQLPFGRNIFNVEKIYTKINIVQIKYSLYYWKTLSVDIESEIAFLIWDYKLKIIVKQKPKIKISSLIVLTAA